MEMELSSPGLTRILIIDDHALVRQGIRMLIESNPGFAVVGEAGERAPSAFRWRRASSRTSSCSTSIWDRRRGST